MAISQNCINLIKRYEGCKLEAYKCPAGVWTIGYGHTSGVKQGQKITQSQAEEFLKSDLVKFEQKVMKYNQKYMWTQNELDALVSFAYNVGSIEQLTANGTRTKAEIAEKFTAYTKAGGKVLAGLVKRRKEEQELFISKSVNVVNDNGRKTLQFGDKGDDVMYLQKKLKELGFPVGYIDGNFGVKTFECVKAFQVNRGLVVDGIVGKKTWSFLE